MATLGSVISWAAGEWTSQEVDNSKVRLSGSVSQAWGLITWEEENTNDESKAYVRLDILKSSDDSVLASDLTRNETVGGIDLADYPYVGTNSIKLKFKLYGKDLSPTVRDLRLQIHEEW